MRTFGLAATRPPTATAWFEAIAARDWILEVEVGFDKEQLAVGILGIDRRDHGLAPGVPVVERRAEIGVEAVIGVEVPDIRKRPISVAGASLVAECRWLEGAAAGIPEVRGAGKAQRVSLGAQAQLFQGLRADGQIRIFVVHHVVEREAR